MSGMNEMTAKAVISCLEIDVDFYRELTVFLMKKHTKILQDDLDWLMESLNTEQGYIMKSQALEQKRLALFEGLGIKDRKLAELIEEAPEEFAPKMRVLSEQFIELIDTVKQLNAQNDDIVKRKLENQDEFVKRAGIFNKPETYDKNASRVAHGSAAKVFREV